MAKKDISKFQKALLSKTKVMKEAPKKEEPKKPEPADNKKEEAYAEEAFPFDPDLMKKLEVLAEKHGLEKEELVNFAIKLLLDFEEELFDQ